MKKILIAGCVLTIVLATAAFQARGNVKPGEPLPSLSLNYLGQQPQLSIPHLNEVYAKYKDKGLTIVGITNEDEATVKKFQEKIPMTYNVAINAPQELLEQFGVDGIPTAFLVDKSGKVVWTGHPMELTEAMIQKVLE